VKKILVICGTRPEAIKLAPVILELRRRPDVQTILCSTGQHRQMLDKVLQVFDLQPQIDLNVMQPNQHLTELLARMLVNLKKTFDEVKPDVVVVQGDTTTVLAASMAAFIERIPIAHVEAGLRTNDLYSPFPEEMNRRVASVIARYHLAPTPSARENLLRESIDPAKVFVTGNTVIDALMWMKAHLKESDLPDYVDRSRRLVLVTAHRRENFGEPFRQVCLALRQLADEFDDIQILYPVHLNPNVQEIARATLEGVPRVTLVPPVDYASFVSLMLHATIILTDSGGVQEEAPAFGKPVLVFREETERPEAVRAGAVRLVGTDKSMILQESRALLTDSEAYKRMSRVTHVYGDGHAASRIADILLTGKPASGEFVPDAGQREH
jgi:UDP-N-acetylglucosamine 2-epimerase (non-hydrolysing)